MHSPQRRRSGICASHPQSGRPGLYLLICLLLWHAPLFGETKTALQNSKAAYIYELELIKSAPSTYYLVIDLPANEIHLKADSNLLRACPILARSRPQISQTQTYRFLNRVDPVTIEPGNAHIRFRNRLLPLDFFSRLTEGPRQHSRLYFSPNLVLHSKGVSEPSGQRIILSASDIKALGSALRPGYTAIFIPPIQSSKVIP